MQVLTRRHGLRCFDLSRPRLGPSSWWSDESYTTADYITQRPMAGGAADHRGKGVNPIKALQAFGQSVWLDYLRRSLFTSGEFTRLIAEDGLSGATSNPSIFEKAIAD